MTGSEGHRARMDSDTPRGYGVRGDVRKRAGRKRVRFVVEVDLDLDPVPGWGDNAEDWRAHLQRHLDDAAPHYHPTVTNGWVL